MNETKVNTQIGDLSSPEHKILAAQVTALGQFHQPYAPLFKELRNHTDAQLACQAMEVCRGAKVIAEVMLEHIVELGSIVDGNEEGRTLFGENQIEALARLMVFSLDQIASASAKRVDHFNAQVATGAQS